MGLHDGHRDRLRTRFFEQGMDSLAEHEILELLLFFVIHRQDTNELAHRLIDEFGSLAGVLDASMAELTAVKGIGTHAATLLSIAKPLCRQYLISQGRTAEPLLTTTACAFHMMPYFFGKQEEHIYLLCLDAKSRPICCRLLSVGTAISSEMPLRRAARLALDHKAVSVVLAHNHPGGDPKPSAEDIQVTASFRQMLEAMQIKLSDHIIIGSNHFVSLAETMPDILG